MKKIFFISLVCTFVLSAIAFCPLEPAYANSAAPNPSGIGGGITFKQNEAVSITDEVLDIVFTGKNSVNVSAGYVMKNETDESISLDTMFIASLVENYEYEDYVSSFAVEKNGVPLDFQLRFFSCIGKNDIYTVDWEAKLAEERVLKRPFGEGSGFFKYEFKDVDEDNFNFVFVPNSYYFSQYMYGKSESTDGVINFKAPSEESFIITQQPVEVTGATVIRTEIPDIYEFLLKNAGYNPSYDKIFEEEFSDYLDQMDSIEIDSIYAYALPLFEPIRYGSYITTVSYLLDFAPNEELRLDVRYTTATGGSNNKETFFYYLSPAKYWNSFMNLTINVILNENRPELKCNSLEFTKLEDLRYQYKSDTLPEGELYLTVLPSSFDRFLYFFKSGTYAYYFIPIGIIVGGLAVVVVIVVLSVKLVKKRKNRIK